MDLTGQKGRLVLTAPAIAGLDNAPAGSSRADDAKTINSNLRYGQTEHVQWIDTVREAPSFVEL